MLKEYALCQKHNVTAPRIEMVPFSKLRVHNGYKVLNSKIYESHKRGNLRLHKQDVDNKGKIYTSISSRVRRVSSPIQSRGVTRVFGTRGGTSTCTPTIITNFQARINK